MKEQQNIIIVAIIALAIGVGIGYMGGISAQEREKEETPFIENQTPQVTSHQMHGAMDAMTSSLEGKTGAELERAFINEMIVHHEGAVEMAEILLKGTTRPELVQLGNAIIQAQTGEIELMRTWKKEWFTE